MKTNTSRMLTVDNPLSPNHGKQYAVIHARHKHALLLSLSDTIQPYIIASYIDYSVNDDATFIGWSYASYHYNINEAMLKWYQRHNRYYQLINDVYMQDLEDGTYNMYTLELASFNDGYQVSPCDDSVSNLSEAAFNTFIIGFMTLHDLTLNDLYIGVYNGKPEISIRVESLEDAKRIGNAYNQYSIWDWRNMVEVIL